MRFFFDNNLSKHLAHAVHDLCQFEIGDNSAFHLTDKFRPDCPDLEWIGALASEGDWVVISQDRLHKHDLERQALKKSGLIVFALDKHWASQQYWPKARNLIHWWPSIMEQAVRFQGGAALRVPWRLSGKGRFEQIQL